MKKIITLLMVLCLVFSLTACGKNDISGDDGSLYTGTALQDPPATEAPASVEAGETGTPATEIPDAAEPEIPEILQTLLDLMNDPDAGYGSLKEIDSQTVYTEEAQSDRLVFSAEGPYISSACEFLYDGEYLSATEPYSDYLAMILFQYIADAVGDMYGQDRDLVNGYLRVITNLDVDSDSASVELDGDVISYKVKITEPLDLSVIDGVWIDDEAAAMFFSGPLADEHTSTFLGLGKVSAFINGSRDYLTIDIAEHGGRTQLSYGSLISILKYLQPVGYEDFIGAYTEFTEVETDAYEVKFIDNREDMDSFFWDADEHNLFVSFRIGEGGYNEYDYYGDDGWYEDYDWDDEDWYTDDGDWNPDGT